MSIDSYISFTNDNDFSSNDEWEIINGPVDTVLTILPEPFPADVIQEHNIVPGKSGLFVHRISVLKYPFLTTTPNYFQAEDSIWMS